VTLVEVVRAVGITARRIRRIGWQSGAGPGNQHWHVWAVDGGRYVLRRHAEFQTLPQIEYEAEVLSHLADLGWLVPWRIGATTEFDGRLYSTYSYVPGRRVADTAVRREERGELMARLHRDAAPLARLGQRPGYDRLHDLAPLRARVNWPDRLAALAETDRALAAEIAQVNDAVEAELGRHPLNDLPATVIHCDFQSHNIHYLRGRFCGIVDFDLAHLDLRVADLAIAWTPELLDGYRGAADPPLSRDEEAAIGPLRRALRLQQIAFLLERADPDALEHQLRRITESRSFGRRAEQP